MMTSPQPIQMSVVVPTFNEAGNVEELVRRLDTALPDIRWEVIFVDDASNDGTGDVVRSVAQRDSRVHLILRHNRRGLSSAVVEGALAASADIVAVMDGDLQHDEAVLQNMYETLAADEADIVSASRFLLEDGADGLSSKARLALSNNGIRLANFLFHLNLTDPLTGFFAVRRDIVVDALPGLSELGFKILLDLITAGRGKFRVKELPFKFREREYGESKLDNRVMYDFFLFAIEKKISRFVPLPARFLSFGMINSVGILVHLMILVPLISVFGVGLGLGQLVATLVAMAFNFTANNALTYNDRQLKGADFYVGFVFFALLCSFGIIGNVSVTTTIHREHAEWTYILPALTGALITVVWNYVATKIFVWGRTKRPQITRLSTSDAGETLKADSESSSTWTLERQMERGSTNDVRGA